MQDCCSLSGPKKTTVAILALHAVVRVTCGKRLGYNKLEQSKTVPRDRQRLVSR